MVCNLRDFLCQATIFSVFVFGVSAINFTTYAIRRRDNKRLFAFFAAGVCIATCLAYILSVSGVLPTPLPALIGRNLFAIISLLILVVSISIWRW
jgi:hypothetical protein